MTISFPTVKAEKVAMNDVVKGIINSAEGQVMVDGIENNWYGNIVCLATEEVRGKSFDSYTELANLVGKQIEVVKTEVFKELASRAAEVERTVTGPSKADQLSRLDKTKAKVDNSIKSAKSVIKTAITLTDQILPEVKDGGHVLWRRDGTARGKTELQTMIKGAKSHARTPKSDLEKAMDAGLTLARRLQPLDQKQRKLVMDAVRDRLEDMDNEEEGEVDDTEDTTPIKAAA